jgi:hypothetical protein
MHLPKEDTIHRGGYYGGGRRATSDQYRRRNGPRAERPWEVFAPHRALSIRQPRTLAGGRAWAGRNRPDGRRRRERRAPTAGGGGQSPRGTGSRGRAVMSPRDPAGSGKPGGCRPYRPEGSHLREGAYDLKRYELLRELAVQFMTEGSAGLRVRPRSLRPRAGLRNPQGKRPGGAPRRQDTARQRARGRGSRSPASP